MSETESKYQKYKECYKRASKKQREKIRKAVEDLKRAPCMDCGGSFPPCAMDFDHRDPTQKLCAVGTMAGNKTMAQVLREIAKCDLVCANCHRIRTYAGSSTAIL